jgi:hypothetical protein
MGEQRDAYLERFEMKLDEWNLKIRQLEVQAMGTHDEALVSYNKQIEALKAKRDGLKGEMAELHTRGEAAWVDLREGQGTAWKVLGDSIEEAKFK